MPTPKDTFRDMTTQEDVFKALNEQFDKLVPDKGGFKPIPGPATYMAHIETATYIAESKVAFALGQPQIRVNCRIAVGDYTGSIVNFDIYLMQPANPERKAPAGLALFKALLEDSGITITSLNPQTIMQALSQLSGMPVKLFVNQGGWARYSGPGDIPKNTVAAPF